MEAILATGVLWLVVVVAARTLCRGTMPALQELCAGRDQPWPIGVQEENDERPWQRRLGTPERTPASWPTDRPDAPRATYIDLADAGGHAPSWAAVEGLARPSLERVRRNPHR